MGMQMEERGRGEGVLILSVAPKIPVVCYRLDESAFPPSVEHSSESCTQYCAYAGMRTKERFSTGVFFLSCSRVLPMRTVFPNFHSSHLPFSSVHSGQNPIPHSFYMAVLQRPFRESGWKDQLDWNCTSQCRGCGLHYWCLLAVPVGSDLVLFIPLHNVFEAIKYL